MPRSLAVTVRGAGFRYHNRRHYGHGEEFWRTFEDGEWKWLSPERFAPKGLCCAHYLARSASGASAEARAYGVSTTSRALLELRFTLRNLLDLRREANMVYAAGQVLQDLPSRHSVHLLRILVYPSLGGNAVCDEIGNWAMKRGFAGILYFNARAIEPHRSSFAMTGDSEWGVNVSSDIFSTLRRDRSCQNIAVFSGTELVRSVSAYRFDGGPWTDNVWHRATADQLDSVVRYGSDYRSDWLANLVHVSANRTFEIEWDGQVAKKRSETE